MPDHDPEQDPQSPTEPESETTPIARLPITPGTAALTTVLNFVAPPLGSLVGRTRVGLYQLGFLIFLLAPLSFILPDDLPNELAFIPFAILWLWALGTSVLVIVEAAKEAVLKELRETAQAP